MRNGPLFDSPRNGGEDREMQDREKHRRKRGSHGRSPVPSPASGEGQDGGRLTSSVTRARILRNNPTDAERILWRHLRFRQLVGYKFRRQRPIGRFIVDFVCLEKNLVIEIDGGQHSEQKSYDSKRDAWIRTKGFRVLRFWDHEVIAQSMMLSRLSGTH